MKKTRRTALTQAQREHFRRRGFVRLEGCFTAADAKPWADDAWRRLGLDPERPETWPGKRAALPGESAVRVCDFAPKACAAILEIVGGPDRLVEGDRFTLSNSFVIQFPLLEPTPWEPPSAANLSNWHIDGDVGKRFLDSPEPGLLMWALWSDARPRGGGGTYLACDSVPLIARHLKDHPEGVTKFELPTKTIITGCKDFFEFSGRAGDVVLAMPYMMHKESVNHSKRARLLSARAIGLREPLDLNRADPREFSLIERTLLSGLGLERLDFRRTA